jgi:diguanylate cyclase (GGDEF)-like protein
MVGRELQRNTCEFGLSSGRGRTKAMSDLLTLAVRGVPRRSLVLATLALAVALGVMSTGIVLSHDRSRNQILANLEARAGTSAGFISTFTARQAAHQTEAGVPYPTARTRPASPGAYPQSVNLLPIFVAQTTALRAHHVLLVDGGGGIIAASPSDSARTLGATAPALARALEHAWHGEAKIAGTPSTFVAAPVDGTSWRLVIAVPNDELYASIGGWALWLPWIVFAVVAILATAVLALLIRSYSERARLEILSTELARAARTDTVTGLGNRRALQERMAQASAYAERYREPLSVLMIDLDRFKQVNDTYGHRMGDEVLRAVAEAMRMVFRASDVYGRWGGDEFLAVLPSTDSDGARGAGLRLCESVSTIDFSKYGLSEQITLSVGCASAVGVPASDLVNEADDSLFLAKRAGRSRVIVGR